MKIPEELIKSQAEYMQLFGSEKESFSAGVRWAVKYIELVLNEGEANAIIKTAIQRFEIAEAHLKPIEKCKHLRIEEIQGGQIERCLDCGKTWG